MKSNGYLPKSGKSYVIESSVIKSRVIEQSWQQDIYQEKIKGVAVWGVKGSIVYSI